MTSLVHAALLLMSVLVLAPIIRYIPLAALGGVLLVTAWRMNEWESIRFFIHTRLRHALLGFAITMVATAALDLTQAILIGVAISAVIYLRQSAMHTTVTSAPLQVQQLQADGTQTTVSCPRIHVYYVTGPIFFGSVTAVRDSFVSAHEYHSVIMSMRGVPLIDVMGAQALRHVITEHQARGGVVLFTAMQPGVMEMFERTGLVKLAGVDHFFWSSAEAISWLHAQRLVTGCARCEDHAEGCAVLEMAQKRRSQLIGSDQPLPMAG